MEAGSSSFPRSSSSSTAQGKYDVFLSFRGKDTRNNFMDHLFNALKVKGISTFRDDEELKKGKAIGPELLEAIKESKFAVIILSEDYASSTWCLDELAHIIFCKKEKGMTVLPIFHYVDPSDVRKQRKTFKRAFDDHEKKENKESVEKWRVALREVGNLAGWHLKDTRPESQDIQEIVGCISLNLKYDAFPYMTKDLVGIYSPVVKLESWLAVQSNDVRFIGIWAMGGMGKTTLAGVVYHMVSKEFEACGFVEDVRKKIENDGCVRLQQDIIDAILKDKDLKIEDKYDGVAKIRSRLSCKKILLVLDDVDKPKQLEMLSREHDWFGPGSRIIITARNKHVLEAHRVDKIYEVEGLNNENALQLFCSKAFGKKHVPDDFIELSNQFLKYASGLPLALEVLGSFLFGKSIAEWESALERLKEFPDEEILKVLKISFNGLQDPQKEIFLHIACFFNNQKRDYVLEKLDILGLFPIIGLKELSDMSLLKIIDNVVWMHDLLEEMGRNIVRQVCLDDPGKRSRLWDFEDINKVLTKNKGTEAVKAMDIVSTYDEQRDACWNTEAFLKMDNLKFLRIYGTPHVPTHLPNGLRILDWTLYPSKSLPSSFQIDELVQLRLQQSKIQKLWIGRKNFDKLKFIDLTDSVDLIVTPNFTGVPNLEKLVLERCTNLREFDPSIGILKKLIHLNLQDCERLIRLPSKFEMEPIMTLEISNCSKHKTDTKFVVNPKILEKLSLDRTAIVDLIKNLPENLWIIKGLEILDLSKADIKELPSSIEHLTDLTSLTLRYCENLVSLPNTICSLKLLKSLDLFGCLKFHNLPENIGNVKGLELLNLCWTAIRDVPPSIVLLKNLKTLYISRWSSSESYSLPTSLERMGLVFRLLVPASHAKQLISHRRIRIPQSPQLSSCSPSLPCSQRLIRSQSPPLLLPSLSGLQSLTYVHLSDCDLLSIPNDIGCLSSLAELNLSGNKFDSLPESMTQLTNLRGLYLEGCKMLQSLENVPSSVYRVIANNCTSLKRFPKLQFCQFRLDHSHMNQYVNCFKLVDRNRLQVQFHLEQSRFEIVIPKREMPNRCRYRSMGQTLGQTLSIKLTYKYHEQVKRMGIVFCVVVVRVPVDKCMLSCSFGVNGCQMNYSKPLSIAFNERYGKGGSQHLCLFNWSPHLDLPPYQSSDWEKAWCQTDANGFGRLQIEISTQSSKVENIGVELVDVDDWFRLSREGYYSNEESQPKRIERTG